MWLSSYKYEGCPEKKIAELSVLQSKSSGNVCSFFLWLILNVLLDTTVSQKDTYSCQCSGVVRLVRYGEVRFKQRADFEFLLAEKELETKIRKLLKIYMLSGLLIKAIIFVGLYELRVLRRRCVMRVPFNLGQKHRQCNGIFQILLRLCLRLFLQQGRSWPQFFFRMQKGRFVVHIIPSGETANSNLYIQTIKTLQNLFRGVRPPKKCS